MRGELNHIKCYRKAIEEGDRAWSHWPATHKRCRREERQTAARHETGAHRAGVAPEWHSASVGEPGGVSGARKHRLGLVWLAGLLCLLGSPGRASASEAEDYVKMGETLYASYNVAPVRLDQAIECFEKALALEPHSYLILSKLAEMYQMKGQSLGEDQGEEKVAAWKKGAEYGEQAIAANPNPVADYKAGKLAALNSLKGHVMKLSKGKANPALVGEILERKLKR